MVFDKHPQQNYGLKIKNYFGNLMSGPIFFYYRNHKKATSEIFLYLEMAYRNFDSILKVSVEEKDINYSPVPPIT